MGCSPCSGREGWGTTWGVRPPADPSPVHPLLALLPGRVASLAAPHSPAAGWRPSRWLVDPARPGWPHLPQQLVQNPQIPNTGRSAPFGPARESLALTVGLSLTELAIRDCGQVGRWAAPQHPKIPGAAGRPDCADPGPWGVGMSPLLE